MNCSTRSDDRSGRSVQAGIGPDPSKDAPMSSAKESIGENLSARAPTLELHEIQATVLRPRPAPYFGTHVLLRVDDAQAGRKFIRRLTPHIASSANWWDATKTWLDVGISYAGLRSEEHTSE